MREHALDLVAARAGATVRGVTATAACFGMRPVANAFGTSVSMIATLGFGRSAMAQSRSTMSCSAGAWSRSTTFAPEAAQRELVRREVLEERQPDHDHEHRDDPTFSTWNRTTANMT